MSFQLEDFHRNVPDADLIADIVRVSELLQNKSPTSRQYNDMGNYYSSTIALRFGSWLSALTTAGLAKTMNRNIPEEDLFRNLVSVWTAIGRQPKSRDLLAGVSLYSWSTYAARFGSWRNALQRFVDWANSEDTGIDGGDMETVKTRKTPRNVNWRLRALVLMRDEATCRLCGATPRNGAKLEVDHIHPWSKGGETVLENLQILCTRCNSGKGAEVI